MGRCRADHASSKARTATRGTDSRRNTVADEETREDPEVEGHSNVPGANVPGANVPGEADEDDDVEAHMNVPGQNVPGQNVPGQNVPGQNVPGRAAEDVQ
jgi:hypothetical protein